MKKKYLICKSALIFLLSQMCFGFGLYILFFVFHIIPTTDTNETANRVRLIALLLLLGIYAIFAPIYITWGSATLIFEDEYMVYKKSFFAKPRKFLYSRMTKIDMDYYGGAWGGCEPAIGVFFNGKKEPVFKADFNYEVAINLIQRKPNGCSVKIDEKLLIKKILRKFTKEQCEPFLKCLSLRQKEDLERTLMKRKGCKYKI